MIKFHYTYAGNVTLQKTCRKIWVWISTKLPKHLHFLAFSANHAISAGNAQIKKVQLENQAIEKKLTNYYLDGKTEAKSYGETRKRTEEYVESNIIIWSFLTIKNPTQGSGTNIFQMNCSTQVKKFWPIPWNKVSSLFFWRIMNRKS